MDALLFAPFLMEDGSRQLCPVHFWDDLNKQSPRFRRRFNYFKEYGKATIDSLLTPEERRSAYVLSANYLCSAYVENLSGGKFRLRSLPTLAQVSPVKGMVAHDLDGDGNLDLLLVGNEFGNEVFSGQYDALNGLILLGDGKGNFQPAPQKRAGFRAEGDAKALGRLHGKDEDLFVVTQNKGALRVFAPAKTQAGRRFQAKPLDVRLSLIFADGRRQAVELYHGSGYLSQSSRTVWLPKEVVKVEVTDSKGGKRVVEFEAQR